MERKIFEVYDMLKDNPAYSENFRESYKDCYKLERLEGYVFKGTWSGYSIKPENDDKSYFTYEGIRGVCTGIFTVYKGNLIKLETYNDFVCKDKYREFTCDMYKYIEAKQKANEILLSLPELSYEAKTQVKDIQAAYETLLQLMAKY